jgi:hypothetical protein
MTDFSQPIVCSELEISLKGIVRARGGVRNETATL